MSNIVIKEGSDQEHVDFLNRTGEIALEIVKLVGGNDKNIVGDVDETHVKVYNDIVESIIKLMIEKEVRFSEVDQIFKLAFQPLDIIKDRVLFSNSMSFHEALKSKFGKDRLDITLKELLESIRQ